MKIKFLIAIMLLVVGSATAQTEAELKQYFEGRHVMIYEFTRGAGRRLIAEFVNGTLIRSSVETREPELQADSRKD